MANIRIGDTVFDEEGTGYSIEERDDDGKPVGVEMLRGKKKRTFNDDNVRCLDQDQGLWQET